MRTHFAFFLAAISLAATPLSAQSFDLPPGSTPTPDVEGPVDDSGVVPVRPRAIPTDRPTPAPRATSSAPTPAPTTTPTPRPAAAAQPRVQPIATPTPRATQPAQGEVLREIPPPVEPPAPQPLPPTGENPAAIPTTAAEPAAPLTEVADQADGGPIWPWLLGALVLLVAVGSGIFLLRRRADAPPPQIERPIVGEPVAGSLQASTEKPRFELIFEVERVSRSMMMLSVKYHLNIANRGDRALRDLAVHADITSANREASETAQLAGPDSQIELLETIERIGPHQSRTITGTLQVPLRELSIFAHGKLPAVVPLVRVRVGSDAIEPVARTFVVGVPSDPMGSRFQPLSLDGPPGSYDGVRAKALA
ncbi:hypothetical protein P7228_02545 [Altererythrobacter arenosus]|uniref:LPXTG cell wall anchor domain-containing protein n=1 Tax=Altererythrobacter arenosus TaxID=3032592 RepID=A0ABY8FSG5_9SPHN|nr:hypothetical protein [Altererythrobacter sp. CAU 1644]WFL77964.1 hypothetical protein P7228_02545 [Altererythrobacter sp. CAU 1644]